jgi:GTPase SAR1 family protein
MTSTKNTTTIDKVRVLVLGDSGVGKTSVIQLICSEAVNHNPPSTIGCFADVKVESGFHTINFLAF